MLNPKPSRYLIIGHARSGTTAIHLAIAGHPNAMALIDEMRIDPFFTKGISVFTYGNDLPEEKNEGFSRLFDALTSLRRSNHQIMARGMKVVCNNPAQAERIVDVLQHHLEDIKVIIIRRNDLVALLGSLMHGEKTGIMHSWYKGAGSVETRRIRISRWRLIHFHERICKLHGVLDRLETSHAVLKIDYEDLLSSPDEQYRNIYRFLNLPLAEPTWLVSRKVLPSPEEYITNYARLTSLLEDLEKGRVPAHLIRLSRLASRVGWLWRKARIG